MHPCLRVPEILSLLFHALLEPRPSVQIVTDPATTATRQVLCYPWPAPGSAQLLNVALTCKAFCEPALDLLWYYLPDLHPLLKCLPENALGKDVSGTLTLKRGLEPEDIDRLLQYARRVRIFGNRDPELCKRGEQNLHRLVLPHISTMKRDRGPLLPNVLELTVRLEDFMGMAVFPSLVVGPLLQSIVIVAVLPPSVTTLSDYSWENLHSVLTKAFPSILAFGVTVIGRNRTLSYPVVDMPPPLTRLVGNLPKLKMLITPGLNLTYDCISTLRTLPGFIYMNTSASQDDLHGHLSGSNLSHTDFDALRSLRLATDRLEPCLDFLRTHALPQLTGISLMLKAEDETTAKDLPSLLTLLHEKPARLLRSLEVVRCRCRRQPPRNDGIVITVNSMSNLLPFVHLQTVLLFVDAQFQLDSNMMKNMAKSWPHLLHLGLKERTIGTVPTVKIGDLAYFTSHCPLLERLAIRVDALHAPEYSAVGDVHPGSKVALFDACTSPIGDDPTQVMRFLAMIFPNLAVLHYGWDDGHEIRYPPAEWAYSAAWDLVHGEMRPIMIHNSPWRRGTMLSFGA